MPSAAEPCPEQVRDRFGPIARIYDLIEVGFVFFRISPRHAVAGEIPASARTILDLGTGTGSVLATLAKTHPKANLTGFDASKRMLAEASKKLTRLRQKGIASAAARLVVGDAKSLPFADGAFDVVTASLFFHEVPPDCRARALDEAVRVLKPGGLMVILDLDKRPEGWRTPAQWAIGALEEDYAWDLSGGGLVRELSGRGLADVRARRDIAFVQLVTAKKRI